MKTRKILKITGISLAAILVLMLIVPFFFEGKVMEIAKAEGNKMLNAKFDFKKLRISLFKDFPNASITLQDFYVAGVDAFEQDTLVKADELSVSVNIRSLFSDQYRIGRVALKDATVRLITLADSTVNWDIMKPDTTATTTAEEEEMAFNIRLSQLSMNGVNIYYNDYAADMHAAVEGMTAKLSGDFTADETDMKFKAAVKELTFRMGLVPYLSKAEVEATINLTADLKNQKYTLRDNVIRLNAIKASIDGWVAMPDSTRMDMDLKLNTNEVGFKDILSLIPAIYKEDFDQIQTQGHASLEANAKGTMIGDSILPAFNMSLVVKDASFRYPALPAGVDQIQINALVRNPGGTADQTLISVKPLSFRMAGMPFALQAVVRTPVSDPAFDLKANGTLDLGNIQKVYPLDEGMNLKGVLTAAVEIAGRMSAIEREQYDQVKASGTLSLKDLTLNMEDMQPIEVKQSTLTFTPKDVRLSETTALIGKNDFTIDGTLTNYLAYALKDELLQGSLNLKSTYLNLNDFISEEVAGEAAVEEEMGIIEVPKNVNLTLSAQLKEIIFGTMNFADAAGAVSVKEGTLRMQGLSMRTMGGRVTADAAYSTAANVKKPTLNGTFKLAGLSFAQAYKELDMVKQMAPVFENLKGNFSGHIDLNADLDETLSPIAETMQGGGSLTTEDVNLSNIAVLSQVATLAKQSDLLAQNVKDLKLNFRIENGRVITSPFTLKLGSKYALNLEGATGIMDQSISYLGSISLPQGSNSLLQTIGLKIGGVFTAPKVSLDTKGLVDQAVNTVTEKALDALGSKLGVDLSDATKQKEALVNEARRAGDLLVSEAQKQSDKLVQEAGSNILKSAAAKVAGQKLVQEAQKQSDRLVQEAEKKGNDLIDKLQRGE